MLFQKAQVPVACFFALENLPLAFDTAVPVLHGLE